MMNINTMRLLVRDDGFADPPEHVKELWPCDEDGMTLFRVSTNCVFRFKESGAVRFLRLAHSSERETEEIRAELDFMKHLADRGFPAVGPVSSNAGLPVEDVHDNGEVFHGVVFERAPGKYVELEDMTDDMFREWGRGLGRLHKASQEFRSARENARPTWEDHLRMAKAAIPEKDEDAHRLLSQLAEWQRSLPKDNESLGLIHYDYELDNLRWDGERFHVFDFDDCVYHWFASDIARATGDVMELPEDEQEVKMGLFLEGYRDVKALNEKWDVEIPRFRKLSQLMKFARTLRSYLGVAPENDPPWIAVMRTRHDAFLAKAREEFAHESL
ncbi:phosphotransferase enzyme family protein [Candidatus Hydrogenedentota bacterium]